MAPLTTMDDTARTDAATGKPASPSAGALLRAARERQGMHIATLAAAIKVAPRKLEALENDRWDELPGPTFTRALAQAVCRALKTEPQEVMELLPPADTSMLDSTFGTINEPFAGRGGREAGWRMALPAGPWLIAAIGLLLAASLVMWLPPGSFGRMLSGVTSTATSAPGGSGAGVTVALPSPSANPLSAAVPPAGTEAPTASSATPVQGAAPTSTGPIPTSPTTPASPASPSTLPPGAQSNSANASAVPAGALVIACAARTWVEVVDGRGRVLVSRNLEAGESLGLDGPLPLQVVVGNASATQATYKGAVIDLASRARDNVARFEVK